MKSLHQEDQLPSRLKHLVADLFRLDPAEPNAISDDEPLIGGSLGLDSLDALEFAISIEEEFGVTMRTREEFHDAFASISSLAKFIRTHEPADFVRPSTPAAAQDVFPGLAAASHWVEADRPTAA